MLVFLSDGIRHVINSSITTETKALNPMSREQTLRRGSQAQKPMQKSDVMCVRDEAHRST